MLGEGRTWWDLGLGSHLQQFLTLFGLRKAPDTVSQMAFLHRFLSPWVFWRKLNPCVSHSFTLSSSKYDSVRAMGCPGSCPGCFQPCCPQLGSGLGQRPSASRAVDLQHETHRVLTDSTLLEVGSQTCVGPERSMVQPLPQGRSALRALITPV